MTWQIFLCKYLAYYIFKPIPIVEKFRRALNLFFPGPRVLLFCLKSVPWTNNEFAGYDVENCENSPLALTNLSHLF